ncbi:MAG: TRAP transporter small permease subunit [Minwuia sp.]|nr:TRAP transporter small permease subunit [Minwuia sp.]
MLNFADAADRLARSIGRAASWLIVPLIFIIMFDVITRKIDIIRDWSADITIETGYSASFILQDMQWHIHGVMLMLAFGVAYLTNAHVRVDIFREMASHRRQAKIELFGLLFMAIPFLCLALWKSVDMVTLSYHQGEGSESLVGIPWRYVIKTCLPIGFILMLAAAIATLVRTVVYLYGSEENSKRAEDGIQYFTDKVVLPKVSLEDDILAKRAKER